MILTIMLNWLILTLRRDGIDIIGKGGKFCVLESGMTIEMRSGSPCQGMVTV